MPFGTRFLQSPGVSNKSMEEPDFLELHNFLADDIIRTREGGTGWMVDLALNADRCNPKTFLLKTRKCSENGSIVLEPALSPENYINPKSVTESKGGFFGAYFTTTSTSSVSINESLSEESVRTTIVSESSAVSQHKYAFVKSTDARGRVKFRIAPNTGFGASMAGTKSTSSSVEVFCEDLVRKSVDFEDLRSTLVEHTVNTSATNIRGEDSLFVVTDVLVAGKISWEVKQNVESKRSGGGNVDAEPVTVAAEAGTSSQRPQEHRQVVNNAVLAFKLAKLSYDSEGKIVGLDKSGSFEGNYTLGPGTEEREGQTAIMVLGRVENGRRGSELIIRSIGHCQTSRCAHTDEIPLQNIVEKGKHQRKLHGSWHLPLKGLVVTKKHSYRISWTKKRKETIYLEKVTVTDVQADNTFTCICNSQLDIPKDDWIWVDCEQWRDSMIKNEVRVNVEFEGSVQTLTVDEEDPIFVIMHKMRDKVPCYKQVLKYKGEVISNPAETITNLGIQDGDCLTLEEDGSNLTNVLELTTANSRSSKGRISNKQSRSLPSALRDILCICKKCPGLNIDEATVERILQEELSEDDDMSPKGFQRLMEAVGKKVELDDIRRAIVLHEDGFDVLHMMDLSLEGKSWFNVGDAVMSASNVDRDASFRSLPNTKAEEDSSGDVGKKTRMVSSTALAVELEAVSKFLQGLFKKEQEEQQQQKAFMTD